MIELGHDWWKQFPKEAHPVKSNFSIQEGDFKKRGFFQSDFKKRGFFQSDFKKRGFFQSDFKKRGFFQSGLQKTRLLSVDFKKRGFFQSPPWIEKLDFAPSAWAGNVCGSSFQLCSHWCVHSAFSSHSSPEAQDDRSSARSTSVRSAIILIVAMGQS